MSSIVLLGSTGSIGVNTLIIAKRYNIAIEALVAGNNIDLLNAQIKAHQPKIVAIANEEDRAKVDHPDVLCGASGILELIERSKSDTVVNALVGYAGLAPTLKATNLGKKVALANKESLVVAGEFIDISRITPIDSEHFGLWYLMNERPVSKLYITASGGAFRDWELGGIQRRFNHGTLCRGGYETPYCLCAQREGRRSHFAPHGPAGYGEFGISPYRSRALPYLGYQRAHSGTSSPWRSGQCSERRSDPGISKGSVFLFRDERHGAGCL